MPYLKIDEGMTPQERRQQAYREKYKRLDPAWDDSIISLAKLFRERAGSGLTVLDAGCGRGNYVLESNQALVKKIVGVDASKEATTGNALAEEIVVADLEKLPFPDSSFDAVTSLWVLEHLRRPDRFLPRQNGTEAWRQAFPRNSTFKFLRPAHQKLVGRRLTRFVLEWLFGRSEADTFRAYYAANTAKDLRRLAKEAGLKELALIENPDPSYLAINGPFFPPGTSSPTSRPAFGVKNRGYAPDRRV